MVFGHRNFRSIFRILKLIYFPTIKNEETYVAGGGGGCSEIVFSTGFRKSAPGVIHNNVGLVTGGSWARSDFSKHHETRLFFCQIKSQIFFHQITQPPPLPKYFNSISLNFKCSPRDHLRSYSYKPRQHSPCGLIPSKQDTYGPNAGLMLVHRLRRWLNNNPTLDQCFVFAGMFRNHMNILC